MADPKATLGTKLAAAKWAVAGYAVLVAALVGAWFLVVPSRPPRFSHPSVWDVLADSRVVVGAQRLVGPVVGVYVILSVVALTVEGRWLDGLGPLRAGKVSRASRAASRKVPVLLANIESLQRPTRCLKTGSPHPMSSCSGWRKARTPLSVRLSGRDDAGRKMTRQEQEQIRQVIQENRQALETARQESERVATSTEEVRESVQEPLRVLREAGVIR